MLVSYLCNQSVNLVEHETYLFRKYIVSDMFYRNISHTVHTFHIKKVIMSFPILEC